MKSTSYRLEFDASGKAVGNLPLEVLRMSTVDGDVENVVYTVKAKERCWFSLADTVPTVRISTLQAEARRRPRCP